MVSRNSKTKRKADEASYELTEADHAVLKKFPATSEARSARIKVANVDGTVTLVPDHPNEAVGVAHLMDALASVDVDFVKGIFSQLASVKQTDRGIDEAGVNFMLSIIKGIAPRDQLETMLAVQMAAVHNMAIVFARRLNRVETIAQQDSAERTLNKLMRTFTAQMEALKRYRTGGEQKVTVQHVSVGEGGQAIVGNVTQGSRDNTPAQAATRTQTLTQAKTEPVPIIGKDKELTPARVRLRRAK